MNETDLLTALAALPGSAGYTPEERYRDFRRVFTGSEEGKRVLREILSWGHMLRPSAQGSPIDPYLTHIREGEANIARRLLITVTVEPPQRPKRQTREKR